MISCPLCRYGKPISAKYCSNCGFNFEEKEGEELTEEERDLVTLGFFKLSKGLRTGLDYDDGEDFSEEEKEKWC